MSETLSGVYKFKIYIWTYVCHIVAHAMHTFCRPQLFLFLENIMWVDECISHFESVVTTGNGL